MKVLAGSILGVLTGCTPGLHPNTVFSFILVLLSGSKETVLFAVSLGVTHSLLNHAPGIFIGIPDKNSALGALPGKEMVRKGHGSKAFYIMTYGSLVGLTATFLVSPILAQLYKSIFPTTTYIKPFLITSVLLILIIESKNVFHGVLTMTAGGLLGILSFNLNSLNSSEMFLPLFTGLFGIPVLLKTKSGSYPTQEESEKPGKKILKPGLKGWFAGIFSSFLPGIGPSSTASVLDSDKKESFLAVLGSVNTTNLLSSLIILSTVGKTRTGLAKTINSTLKPSNINSFEIIGAVVVSVGVALTFSSKIVEIFTQKIPNIKTDYIKYSTLALLIIIVTSVSGLPGIGLLLISSGTGLLLSELESRKSVFMSVIIIPVLFRVLF